MPKQSIICLIMCTVTLSGCHWVFPASRKCNCPTDLCKAMLFCTGEDALYQCPCGPSQEFYGHKPTCWGVWPASGAAWRDIHCQPATTECLNETVEYGPTVVAPAAPNDAAIQNGGGTLPPGELPPLIAPDPNLPLPAETPPQSPETGELPQQPGNPEPPVDHSSSNARPLFTEKPPFLMW